MEKARRYVAVSAVVSIAVIVAGELGRSEDVLSGPNVKRYIAYGFVFFMLSAGADLGLEAAGAFALLAMTSIVLAQADDALKFFGARAGVAGIPETPPPVHPPAVVTIRR